MSIKVIRSSQRSHYAISCQVTFISFHIDTALRDSPVFPAWPRFQARGQGSYLAEFPSDFSDLCSSFENWVLPCNNTAVMFCCLRFMASSGSQFWFVPLLVMFDHKLKWHLLVFSCCKGTFYILLIVINKYLPGSHSGLSTHAIFQPPFTFPLVCTVYWLKLLWIWDLPSSDFVALNFIPFILADSLP